jgi:hypothetical protein
MLRVPGRIIERYEVETLQLPGALRTSADEYGALVYYVGHGAPDPRTIDSTPPGRFHPSRHEPRYDSPPDAELWRTMTRAFDVPSSPWFWLLLVSDELRSLEDPTGPTTPTGPLDLSRILAPQPEDPMARRASLTDDLHHLRVIARQLDRMWGPMVGHVREVMARTGGSPGPGEVGMLHRLQRDLARPLIRSYEAEVLGLPGDLRMTDGEFECLLGQVWTHCSSGRTRPVPWRFDVRLHPPRYSEPGDREIWRTCLGLLPADLPNWLEEIARSGGIVELERRPRTRATAGASRPDDREREPYGTEEDGPQPP